MRHGKHQSARRGQGVRAVRATVLHGGDHKGFIAKAPPEKDLNEMREQAMRLFGGKSVPGRQNRADV